MPGSFTAHPSMCTFALGPPVPLLLYQLITASFKPTPSMESFESAEISVRCGKRHETIKAVNLFGRCCGGPSLKCLLVEVGQHLRLTSK
jgi:hypothetical protein